MMAAWWSWCVQRWHGFWFAHESALNLAAARIIFAAHALWLLLSRDLPALSGVPDEFWAHVPKSLHWRYFLWEGHPQLEQWLQGMLIIALGAAILGIVPRLACFVAGLLLYHGAPLEAIIWTSTPWGRGLSISVLALLTLAFSHCGDALCLVHSHRKTPPQTPSLEYNWPLRLVQLFLCQVYFFAGYAKFFRFGWGWMSAETIQGWLLAFNQPPELFVFTTLGPWIADHPALCLGIAIGAPLLELSVITVVFWKRARLWIIPLVLLFHTGIFFSMSIAFLKVPQWLIFVNWQAVSERWAHRRQRRAPSTHAAV